MIPNGELGSVWKKGKVISQKLSGGLEDWNEEHRSE
jgi:hypothetical protein